MQRTANKETCCHLSLTYEAIFFVRISALLGSINLKKMANDFVCKILDKSTAEVGT
jgi:hypothetical protein